MSNAQETDGERAEEAGDAQSDGVFLVFMGHLFVFEGLCEVACKKAEQPEGCQTNGNDSLDDV